MTCETISTEISRKPQSMIEHQEVIDSEQCGKLLRCTPEHAEELARQGELPGFKIGRNWLFVRDDLLSYLAQRARAEAESRRSKVKVDSVVPQAPQKSRRRPAPELPVLPQVA